MDVVLPAAIAEPFTGWQKELLKFPKGNIMVHSKVIVIDAFGDPSSGHHRLTQPGPSGFRQRTTRTSSLSKGDAGLASAYAVNVLAVYNQYSWRYHREPDRTQPAAGVPFALKKKAAAPALRQTSPSGSACKMMTPGRTATPPARPRPARTGLLVARNVGL